MSEASARKESRSAEAEPAGAAAVLHGPDERVDELLGWFVARQVANGVRVCGLVQQNRWSASGKKAMELVDIVTNQRFAISQDLGAASGSCNLDPAGIAAAAVVLRRALEQAPQLVVVNRFGALESERGGFASELLELMSDGVPVLTAVAERHLDAWLAFCDQRSEVLAPSLAALEGWAERVLARRASSRAGGPLPDAEARGAER